MFFPDTPCNANEYCIFEAYDSWQAMEMISQRRYFSLVVDADLPGLSSFNLIKKLVQKRACDTPVIFLQGYRDMKRAKGCLEEREFKVPFQPAQLLERIWSIMDQGLETGWEKVLSPLQCNLLKVPNANLKRIFSHVGDTGIVERELVADADKHGSILDQLNIASQLYTLCIPSKCQY